MQQAVKAMNKKIDYVIVTPVRDEIAHVEATLRSVTSQTLLPSRWIIVDDGSSDGTELVLDQWAARYDWLEVIHRPNRGKRVSGGGVMEAFRSGLERIDNPRWDYLVKLDADLSFAPTYFENCFAKFESNSSLGIGGGTVCVPDREGHQVESPDDPPFHVRGATKIYRQKCWLDITPLISAPGWDTVDEVSANLHGWKTCTFQDLHVIQHKMTGAADSTWSHSVKNGKANFHTGYHPVFMVAKSLRRMFRKPYFVDATGLLAGYISCYLTRQTPQADQKTIRYLRRQQINRLLLRPSIYG